MNAVDFLKERARMCKFFANSCSECPIFEFGCGSSNYEETVSAVEQWSKEHPVMTNAMKFEEVFGCFAPAGGWPYLPQSWWDEPYKEPEGAKS
mgnify:CR=1 FL=1